MSSLQARIQGKQSLSGSVAISNKGGGIIADHYKGVYEVTPTVEKQTLQTKSKIMDKNVTINGVQYSEVTNSGNGTTVIIG